MAFYFDEGMEQSVMNTQANTTTPTGILKKARAEFSRLRKITLKKLNQFKQSGKCLAISSYAFGEGVFHSFVEDIYQSGQDEIVVLKWYDQNNFVSLTHVHVDEIVSITPVNGKFNIGR